MCNTTQAQAAQTNSVVQHGVMLSVFKQGLFITGKPASGKSELALGLIQQGHALIADDAVEFYCTDDAGLYARCPDVLQNYLHVYGLGILDVAALYGKRCIQSDARVDLVLSLEHEDSFTPAPDPLQAHYENISINGVTLPRLRIPVNQRRNLIAVTEAAVQNHILLCSGHHAGEQFTRRQRQAINNNSQ